MKPRHTLWGMLAAFIVGAGFLTGATVAMPCKDAEGSEAPTHIMNTL